MTRSVPTYQRLGQRSTQCRATVGFITFSMDRRPGRTYHARPHQISATHGPSIFQAAADFAHRVMLILIKNADVFAPQPLGIRHVLVAGDRIVYVGKEVPELDTRLRVDERDAQGGRLIPGFIDPHAHVTGGGGEAGFETSVPAPLLSEYTRAGITTVVGLLGTDDLVRTTSALIARLKALRTEGLSAWGYTGGTISRPRP